MCFRLTSDCCYYYDSFSLTFIQEDLGQIRILGKNWYWFQFELGNDSNCNFINFSVCSPALTNFWQSVFVSLFSMVSTPPLLPTNVFFVGDKFFFFLSCSYWLERFQISCGASLLEGDLITFLGEGGQTIFFHKGINDQSFKLKNS